MSGDATGEITLFELPEVSFPNDQPNDWRPEQLRVMHREYGVRADQTCGGCVHCVARTWNKRNYYKCTRFGRFSHGPGTDWRRKWPACGGWLDRSLHPLPEGWILLRVGEGWLTEGWLATNDFYVTMLCATEIEAIEAAQIIMGV